MNCIEHIPHALYVDMPGVSVKGLCSVQYMQCQPQLYDIVDALERADKDVTSPFLVGELDQANHDWTDILDRAKKLQPDGTSVIPAKVFKQIGDAFNNTTDVRV